jgi:hypothetical protein
MTLPRDAPPGPGDEAVRRWFAARARAEAERDGRLASDAEREKVCELLNSAFADGRLTSAELEERTTRALAGRTHGDLAEVMSGLGAMGHPALWNAKVQRGIWPRIVFWVVGFVTAPFLFIAAMALLFGSDLGDRVFGIVLLVLFLPGLIAVYRWAHPRT